MFKTGITMKRIFVTLAQVVLVLLVSCSGRNKITVILQGNASNSEQLAAKEIRRYIYMRTGDFPVITTDSSLLPKGTCIYLRTDQKLTEQEFSLKSEKARETITILGGSPTALLYGAYEFAELLGVRFYLHGDVIPDKKISFSLPEVDIHRKPLFNLRGILPFHDFPEGPDWWNENDYKAIVAQLPKLKMNFIGFHTYPWRTDFNGEGPKAEPLVWIGTEDQVNSDGTVNSAYPVLHFHTADSTWGYKPTKTSDFLSGASQLFECDNYGADYMKDISPWPHTESENINTFNVTGKLYSSAFSLAGELGVKVCVGTESPLIIPETELKRNKQEKLGNEVIKSYYKGIFKRITNTYPVDYYWLWTPEGWTWSSVDDKTVTDTRNDMEIAYEALKETGSQFTLATCGWVLGPPKDRAEFDRVLPKDMPFSCINRGLGYTPVDKSFNEITGRSKWSIPWMEDDPSLLTAQLWAGRMRKDALDSWKYRCDGLLGIHWRTRIIGPTVSALAKAAWECDRYDQQTTGRDLPVEDFYSDWTNAEFGISDPELVKIFTDLDGKGVELKEGYKGDAPLNASDWINGPGGLMINKGTSDLKERISRYDFIPKMESFREKIKGVGNLERFDYWLNVFMFNRAVLETTLTQVKLNLAMDSIRKEKDNERQVDIAKTIALPLRIDLSEKWEKMNHLLLAFASTNGELGTIANIEMHNIRKNGNLTGHDDYLKSILKTGLPEDTNLSAQYSGVTRIIVTTNQSVIRNGEDFYLRIRVLSESDNLSGFIFYRPLGAKKYKTARLKLIGSHVFEVRIPAEIIPGDFEYYIQVSDGSIKTLFPVTAGQINNSVIVI